MKKLWVALALLIVIFACSLINIWYLDGFIEELTVEIEASHEHCEAGDLLKARDKLLDAVDVWEGGYKYTHIFIRHPEINATTNIFFELYSDLCAEEPGAAEGSYRKLLAQLESLATMEHLTLGSVF